MHIPCIIASCKNESSQSSLSIHTSIDILARLPTHGPTDPPTARSLSHSPPCHLLFFLSGIAIVMSSGTSSTSLSAPCFDQSLASFVLSPVQACPSDVYTFDQSRLHQPTGCAGCERNFWLRRPCRLLSGPATNLWNDTMRLWRVQSVRVPMQSVPVPMLHCHTQRCAPELL